MDQHHWIKQFPAAVIVCDCNAVSLEMNDKAAKTHESDGAYALVGKKLLDFHGGPARSNLAKLLEACEKNIYTLSNKDPKGL